ncbi:PEP-CTERM sorting domain-containing protein [Luteolibacter arcticus]|uniref:PEP-CTERM sorting domain-containing protein n=1 Tax=Luteolibacter arcticus TaxID=1581411 RepID=A0ABT3GJP1_9BACT|nr:PEP-CTERM sorting domain-containing protein [Luteolibacter arcticus]MCW1923696.1 PEP-CTERM sorting domain-containing protein [Luteolibacter arcticus]
MKLLPLALAAAAFSNLATATVVNIDFTTTSGTGYTGLGASDIVDTGTTWNTAAYSGSGGSVTMTDMVDSSGAATLVDFTVSGIEGAQNPAGSMERLGGFSNLMRDYIRIDAVTTGAVLSVGGKFSGLVVGASYDLYFYGQGEHMAPGGPPSANYGQNSLFTVNGTSKQTGWDGTANGDGSLDEGIEYVKFTAIAINGGAEGGVINFNWANVVATGATPNVLADEATNGSTPPANTGSRFAALNGIQLVSIVPEPSSALLALLGMTGLLVRRRR